MSEPMNSHQYHLQSFGPAWDLYFLGLWNHNVLTSKPVLAGLQPGQQTCFHGRAWVHSSSSDLTKDHPDLILLTAPCYL
uniref:Uncharacterized protein n=1 Tax=Mus spicilegus TaxID=10103 RepID=A0A8C6HIU9_MUSSI